MRTKVHRILIVGQDALLTSSLKRELLGVCSSLTVIELPLHTEHQELELNLALEAPTAVFLETAQLERSLQIARWVREADHNLQMIGFSPEIGTEGLLHLMRAGVREWLPLPASSETLELVLERIQSEAANHPPSSWNHGQLVSFLPAKPGSGTSTIALHAAQVCAKVTGNRILLLDLDLQCGALGFASKAAGGLTMNEGLQHAHQLDAALWTKLVARRGDLDILPAGSPTDSSPLEPAQLRRIFGFAVGRYPLVLADLPGGLDPGTVLTLEQSSRIILVCTTDLASLHLARRKLDLCRSIGVADKIEILVNRATFHFGLTPQGLVEILGRAAITLLPNAFVPLQMALKDGRLLDEQTPFVQSLAPVIQSITGTHIAAPEARRFLPALSVSRALGRLRAVVSSLRGTENGPGRPALPAPVITAVQSPQLQPVEMPALAPTAPESPQPQRVSVPAKRAPSKRPASGKRRKPAAPVGETSDRRAGETGAG